mgnify:FL=1
MQKNNQFFIEKLKNVVFIGNSGALSSLINVTKKCSLNYEVITSQDQAKLIDKKIKFKVFNKIDINFSNYIFKKFKAEETLFLSIGSRWIFKKKLINDFFKNNLINYHPTRLPLDGGSGGFSWQIMRADRIHNQLFHLVNETIDGGPIIYNQISLFPSNCKIPKDYYNYYLDRFPFFYEEFLQKLLKNQKFTLKYQPEYLSRYCPRLNTDLNGWIDWSVNSLELSRFIDAFDKPYKGASTLINNTRVRIRDVHLHGGDSSNHPFMSGIISRKDMDWLVVSTIDKHMLIIKEILDEKGKNIIKSLKVGDRFFTPSLKLDEAKKKRIKVNQDGFLK